ncbi:Cadmium/zinc-transporting ATPase 4 [Nosema bombycis CQ1]|uniref:Cadmium/zinc-transporting ATPase 4 n=1 Tax=Nosema bombycis (strain CQ1 / CVCC 102059) TaxID=578461 RepID=R0KRL0_NOSB1|nr:Cadmium/zinc-transporting ATPase 4 [Nosema bombycis CQ1]|eukprot:EOB12852.1 Cadmium/zinc-transporting ATPase 4 [Nosema bombycis CQ1]
MQNLMCMNIQTKIIQMRNLYCLMCEDKVSEVLNNVKGIIEHRTNVYTKELFLKYDSSVISFANILKYLNDNKFMTNETYKFLSYEFLLILLIIVYKILYIVFYSLDFFVLFIVPTILFLKNSVDLMRSKKWTNNSVTCLSSILCYFLGLYLFFFDDYTIRSAEYVILSVDILFYSLVNSFTLSYIVNISKINLYSINQIKNRHNKMEKKLKVGNVIEQSEGYVYVDGTIVEGNCVVDESDITGEEALKHKGPNEQILSSTQIIEGSVKLRIDKVGKQTYTGKVLSLIEEAGFKETYTSSENNSLYTVCLSLLSAAIYYLWSIEDYKLIKSFKIFILTLISLCPCVFLISEPLISLKGRKYLLSHDIVMNEFKMYFQNIRTLFL